MTKSCAETNETIKLDGNEYPLVKMEISSDSHPFYTGKAKLVDTAGRIDKFKNKYQNLKSSNLFNYNLKAHTKVWAFCYFAIMNIILFDNNRDNYYPLSLTRPISFFRVGILTIKQKWEKYYGSVSIKTIDYLSEKFPLNITNDNIWVDASIIPSNELIKELDNLRSGEGLVRNGKLIVFRASKFDFNNINRIESHAEFNQINYLWDIYFNGQR